MKVINGILEKLFSFEIKIALKRSSDVILKSYYLLTIYLRKVKQIFTFLQISTLFTGIAPLFCWTNLFKKMCGGDST